MNMNSDAANPADSEPEVLRVFQTRDETRSFYDKIAHVYDLLADHSEQPMREIALQLLAPQAGETVLEIGFATGACLGALAEAVGPGGLVAGIDLSPGMLETARKRLAGHSHEARIDLSLGDASDLPYDDGSIDAIFSSFTLELFDTPELVPTLEEWRRVLKPGGRLVNASVSKMGEAGLVLKTFEWTHRHFPNLMDCRPIYVQRAMEAAGFAIRGTRLENMWVPVEIVLGIKPTAEEAAGQTET